MLSCIGSETDGTSILKEKTDSQNEVVPMEELQKEDVEPKIEEEVVEIEKVKNEETIEEILMLEEKEQKIEEEKLKGPLDWKVIRVFEDKVSKEHIKYQGELPEQLSYVIILSEKANLREKPTTESEILGKARQGQRLEVLELVENKEEDQWFKIKDKERELFVYKGIVRLREFRFDKAEEKIEELEEFIKLSNEKGEKISTINAYIPNPNNRNFLRNKDRYGNVQDQSAKGYYNKDKVYVPDGTIVAIEEELNGDYRVRKQGGDEPYLDVPKKMVSIKNEIKEMPKKVIVVDVENQNFTVYEKELEEWNLISYTYSKTGRESKLGFKTPRGDFAVLAAKKVMTYNDSKGKKQGYANYAIRFSGGGYIHGTPFDIDEKKDLEKFRIRKEATLGSYSGTRKCVRNTVDHAKFLFDWVVGTEVKEGNFQGIEEKVSVIVM